ncbi:hypothetical protein C8R43DRAFT_1135546 [Mycena crocata]|nr:hypothetical protein C8R43DRAFT_1135546 [Mycena crocata]
MRYGPRHRDLRSSSVASQFRTGSGCVLTRNRSSPGAVPNEMMKKYYDQRALRGAGIIVSEGLLITWPATEWPDVPGIWNKAQVEGWKKITDSVHAVGDTIYCQLWHLGRVSHPEAPEQIAAGVPVYAPSAIAARGGKFRHITGTPGYVTFLDSTSNQRTDKRGGSVENRARFALETLKVLIDVWGPDRVVIKLSPAVGYNNMGMPLQETIDTLPPPRNQQARIFAENGLRFTTCSERTAQSSPRLPSAFLNGAVSPAEAEELVAGRNVAGMFIGINWIAHPDVVKLIRAGNALDNVPDFATFYGVPGLEPTMGYLDYKEGVY